MEGLKKKRTFKDFVYNHSPIVYTLIWFIFLPFSMYGIQVFVEKRLDDMLGDDYSLFLFPIGVVGAIYVAELSYYIWEITQTAKRNKKFLPYKIGSAISWIFLGLCLMIVLTICFIYANSWKAIIAIITWVILSSLKYSTEIIHKSFNKNTEHLKIIE